jgi:hypothetical protein
MKMLMIVISVFAVSVSVHAADFSVPLLDFDGKVIDDGTPEKKPFTLGAAAIRALMATFPDEVSITPLEKFRRAMLASKIHDNADLVVNVEDTALLKNLIGKAFAPMIVYRAWPLLDPTVK